MSERKLRLNTSSSVIVGWIFPVVMVVLSALGTPAEALAEVNGGLPAVPVMFGLTGIASIDRIANARALVVLDDLRLVDGMSPRAERSVIPVEFQENNRHHLGVLLPADVAVGSAAWSNAPLITVEDARRTVTFGDDAVGPLMMAGYFLPTESEPNRRPWLQACFGDGGPIAAELRVGSRAKEAKGMVLREVAGMDDDHGMALDSMPGMKM